MAKHSAGILLYRKAGAGYEVLLGHPGGPFWAKKDNGAWSIPKGEFEPHEEPLAAAKREFTEETGSPAPEGNYLELGTVKRPDGKLISAWAVEGDLDIAAFKSNTFEMEWPPKSGQKQTFPEIDRTAWMSLSDAQAKLHTGQIAFLEQLARHLGAQIKPEEPRQASLF